MNTNIFRVNEKDRNEINKNFEIIDTLIDKDIVPDSIFSIILPTANLIIGYGHSMNVYKLPFACSTMDFISDYKKINRYQSIGIYGENSPHYRILTLGTAGLIECRRLLSNIKDYTFDFHDKYRDIEFIDKESLKERMGDKINQDNFPKSYDFYHSRRLNEIWMIKKDTLSDYLVTRNADNIDSVIDGIDSIMPKANVDYIRFI